ncbi:mediator of RNA polymerase II transcription subunit 31 isoform X1 [Drosophila santomea]|uniref:mediator of RNA polymerase II transcription subunit 31 isoform X1 n=1 Tax=Drosophila santomea TaxID=129105 RepID=UPI001953040B|nr:mediator of RNA polymerase II transcription subunit 31 isoform X1 [Drosophila santomea]XP_039490484.1 mediator of RNA polymerase II transcription subunit 31 isoform X1 [Drosophila santomea]
MAKMYGKGKTAIESEELQKRRWQIELEFVQCLSNPNYLNFLAQRGFFKDQSFINYLKYLQYWKEPDYAKYLMYPMCLYFLDLLQYEHFRREIVNSQCCKFIDDQAILQWQHYTRKRIKLIENVTAAQQQQQQQQANGVQASTGGELAAPTPNVNGIASTTDGQQTSSALQPAQAQQGNPQQQLQINGLASGANIKIELN